MVHEVPGSSANPPLAVLQLWLVYGGMGAVFGLLYRRAGTLWAPILAHGLNNGIALVMHSSAERRLGAPPFDEKLSTHRPNWFR